MLHNTRGSDAPDDTALAAQVPGLRFANANSTPTGVRDVTPGEWDMIVRRALFQTSRNGVDRSTVVSRIEATLSHLSIRYDREPHRRVTFMRPGPQVLKATTSGKLQLAGQAPHYG